MVTRNIRLALFISGGGSTMQAILWACKDGTLKGIDPVLVIASKPNAKGIAKAQEILGDERVVVVDKKRCESDTDFGAQLLAQCRMRGVDWIGQYGWLPHTPDNVINAYAGRIINQHPGPLMGDGSPYHFGGKGLYGLRVHHARLRFVLRTGRDFWTKAVTHYVVPGDGYDHGKLIHEIQIPIHIGDTAETLQERVLPLEHQCQIEALQKIAASNGLPPTFQHYDPLVRPEEVPIFHDVLRETEEYFRKK